MVLLQNVSIRKYSSSTLLMFTLSCIWVLLLAKYARFFSWEESVRYSLLFGFLLAWVLQRMSWFCFGDGSFSAEKSQKRVSEVDRCVIWASFFVVILLIVSIGLVLFTSQYVALRMICFSFPLTFFVVTLNVGIGNLSESLLKNI